MNIKAGSMWLGLAMFNSRFLCAMVRKTLIFGLISVATAQFTINVDWAVMPDTAENTYCAQTLFGLPATLTRMTPANSITNNRLTVPPNITPQQKCRQNKFNKYSPQNRKGPCPRGYCANKIIAGTLGDATKTKCDEYPPASFMEGGGMDKGGMQAIQRCVTPEESEAQSAVFRLAFTPIDSTAAYPSVTITTSNIPEGLDCSALANDVQALSSLVDI
jgi:hypothetical protein